MPELGFSHDKAADIASLFTKPEQKPSIPDSILGIIFMILKIPEKFSKFRHVIEKQYKDDNTFKEIYEDYQTYLRALQFWERSSSNDAPVRWREYSELVSELEEELTQILVNNGPVKPID